MFRSAVPPGCVPGRSSWCARLLLCWICSAALAVPAAAQDPASPSQPGPIALAALARIDAGGTEVPPYTAAPQLPTALTRDEPRRPKSLVPLYVSFASLQAMDVHSTRRALDRGAVEANPLMKGVAGNALAMSAVKIGGSAAAIYAAEKMWKKNRKAAVIFMLAANAGMALVVQHNYRVE